MHYYMAKMKEHAEEKRYRHYTADSFYCIMRSLGVNGVKIYTELCNPVEEKDPMELVKERAQKMGLKAVSE